METLYTVTELANILKMSKSKIYALMKSGKIPHIQVGKSVRITETQLKKWLESHEVLGSGDVGYTPNWR